MKNKFFNIILIVFFVSTLSGCQIISNIIEESSESNNSDSVFDVSKELYESAKTGKSYVLLPEIPLKSTIQQEFSYKDYSKTLTNSFILPIIAGAGNAETGEDQYERGFNDNEALATFDIAYFNAEYLNLYLEDLVFNSETNLFGTCAKIRDDSVFDNENGFFFIDSDITCEDYESYVENHAGWKQVSNWLLTPSLDNLLDNPVRSINIYFALDDKLVFIRFLSTSTNLDDSLNRFLAMYENTYVNRDQTQIEIPNIRRSICGTTGDFSYGLYEYSNNEGCIFENIQKSDFELDASLPDGAGRVIVYMFGREGYDNTALINYALSKDLDFSADLANIEPLTPTYVKSDGIPYEISYITNESTVFVIIRNASYDIYDIQVDN